MFMLCSKAIPPFLVTDNVNAGMQRLLLGQFAFLTAAFIVTLALFVSHPPTPPSKSTQDRIRDKGAPTEVLPQLLANFSSLLRDRNFLLLLAAFSVGLAIFNSILTVINQFLDPYGFTNDEVIILCS